MFGKLNEVNPFSLGEINRIHSIMENIHTNSEQKYDSMDLRVWHRQAIKRYESLQDVLIGVQGALQNYIEETRRQDIEISKLKQENQKLRDGNAEWERWSGRNRATIREWGLEIKTLETKLDEIKDWLKAFPNLRAEPLAGNYLIITKKQFQQLFEIVYGKGSVLFEGDFWGMPIKTDSRLKDGEFRLVKE